MSRTRTLHILNKAPDHPRHKLCLAAVESGDAVLLTENGVLGAGLMPTSVGHFYALSSDLQARGLAGPIEGVEVVSYNDMVALAATAEKVISW